MSSSDAISRVVTVAIAAIVLGSILSCHSESNHSAASTLHRGLSGEPGSLDPAKAGDNFSYELLDDLYEGLTTQAPDGSVIPGVAERWSTSEDGLTYTFELRHDAKWSNGSPLRAQNFIKAWRRLLDPKNAAPAADNLRIIAGASEIMAGRAPMTSLQVSAPRDDRLIVTLAMPAVYFPELLSHPSADPIYSEEAAASHTAEAWISNGAYALESWIPGTAIKLVRNPFYWNRTHAPIDNVEYIPAPDEATELARYRGGLLDLTESVPAGAVNLIHAERPTELHVAPYIGTSYYAFNLHKAPFKDNLGLRQSLAMAIDRNAILKTILPFGQRSAFGFVAEGVANYTPQVWDWAALSDADRMSRAKTLYEKAGYSRVKPLKVVLLINSNPSIKQLALAVADMWRSTLGVEVTLTEEEYRVFLETRKDPSRYDVVRLGWSADYNDAGNFLNTLRTGSANNDPGYSSATYDALLDRAAHSTDPKERREILESAELTMLADYPIMPIYYFSSKRLVKPYITGATPSPLNRLYSKNISIAPH